MVGILTAPGISNIQNLVLSERINKLCELVEELKLEKLNYIDISMACQINNELKNKSNP